MKGRRITENVDASVPRPEIDPDDYDIMGYRLENSCTQSKAQGRDQRKEGEN